MLAREPYVLTVNLKRGPFKWSYSKKFFIEDVLHHIFPNWLILVIIFLLLLVPRVNGECVKQQSCTSCSLTPNCSFFVTTEQVVCTEKRWIPAEPERIKTKITLPLLCKYAPVQFTSKRRGPTSNNVNGQTGEFDKDLAVGSKKQRADFITSSHSIRQPVHKTQSFSSSVIAQSQSNVSIVNKTITSIPSRPDISTEESSIKATTTVSTTTEPITTSAPENLQVSTRKPDKPISSSTSKMETTNVTTNTEITTIATATTVPTTATDQTTATSFFNLVHVFTTRPIVEAINNISTASSPTNIDVVQFSTQPSIFTTENDLIFNATSIHSTSTFPTKIDHDWMLHSDLKDLTLRLKALQCETQIVLRRIEQMKRAKNWPFKSYNRHYERCFKVLNSQS